MTTDAGAELNVRWSQDAALNEGFILREDAALKAHLQGLRVRDSNAGALGRTIPVYFRLPEQEARRRDYPYITIDLISAAHDPEREHSGRYYFNATDGYTPPGRTPATAADTDYPIPMLLTYQVTSFARFIQHDRQLMSALVTQRLPSRFGALEMVAGEGFGDDNSIRRLEFINGPVNADSPDPSDPNKRIFRKAYTVAVSSEMFSEDIHNLTKFVATVIVNVGTDVDDS